MSLITITLLKNNSARMIFWLKILYVLDLLHQLDNGHAYDN